MTVTLSWSTVECWVKGHQKFFFAADWASPRRITESHRINALVAFDKKRQNEVIKLSFTTRDAPRWVAIEVQVLLILPLHKMGNTAKGNQVEGVQCQDYSVESLACQ